ncbi:MAG: FliH/SctL family protein [Desulfatitalea sp.]
MFQPLYHCSGPDGRTDNPEEETALIEQARCRGTQSGLTSGQNEACRMARSSLAPSLKAFIHTANQLAASNQHIKTQVSAKIIELALAITERIMGEPTALAAAATTDIKGVLEKSLFELNRLSLHLNPDDIQGIESLLIADGLEWPNHPDIRFESDASVLPGEMRIANQTASRQLLDQQAIPALAELLGRGAQPSI